MLERGPIFVAGLERTGTSLMYALLASHPNISMTRRTNLWTYFYGQFGDLAVPTNLDACLETMGRYKRLVKLDLDYPKLRADFVQGEMSYARLFRLLYEQVAERAGKPRWGDKSLNVERYTHDILEAYPGARVLHMMRDPRDRYASVLARWKHRRGDVGAGTAAWLWSAELAQDHVAAYPEQYRIVRYESLVADPEAGLREICAFIDEPYVPSMLTMAGAQRFREQGSNSSYGRREAGVISTGSVGKYRSVLSPKQIAVIQAVAGDPMRAHGYELEPLQMGRFDQARFWTIDYPYSRGVVASWRTREALRNRRGRHLPEYRLVTDSS